MTSHHVGRLAAVVAALVVGAVPARGEDGPATDADARALAARIDQLVGARWKANKVKPAAAADDAVFLRRAYLDLTGRIPPATDARDFLDDSSPDKRAQLVERLLGSEEHARHLAAVWRRLLLADAGPLNFGINGSLQAWLEKQARGNTRYDRLAREVLTAAPDSALRDFFQANEFKPENLAGSAARIFLGVRLECAQCHNHPFARYTRKQFWEFAAFFSRVGPPGRPESSGKPELTIPGTKKVVQASLFTGKTLPLKPGADPRVALADWVTGADNPYFARTAVNRLWAHLLGVGLIDPPDELGEPGEPSHPELLDELVKQLVGSGFDVRFLIRAITLSKTYQLSSLVSHPSENDRRLFARRALRGLTAEQLYDSISQATGTPENAFGSRGEFVARFNNPERPVDASLTIPQALHLMNSKAMARATSPEGNRLLKALAEAKGMTTAERVEELYLIVLSRRPRAEESARLVKYVDGGGPRRNCTRALADVLWSLLNSPEFTLNH
jgi:hypothetical protein